MAAPDERTVRFQPGKPQEAEAAPAPAPIGSAPIAPASASLTGTVVATGSAGSESVHKLQTHPLAQNSIPAAAAAAAAAAASVQSQPQFDALLKAIVEGHRTQQLAVPKGGGAIHARLGDRPRLSAVARASRQAAFPTQPAVYSVPGRRRRREARGSSGRGGTRTRKRQKQVRESDRGRIGAYCASEEFKVRGFAKALRRASKTAGLSSAKTGNNRDGTANDATEGVSSDLSIPNPLQKGDIVTILPPATITMTQTSERLHTEQSPGTALRHRALRGGKTDSATEAHGRSGLARSVIPLGRTPWRWTAHVDVMHLSLDPDEVVSDTTFVAPGTDLEEALRLRREGVRTAINSATGPTRLKLDLNMGAGAGIGVPGQGSARGYQPPPHNPAVMRSASTTEFGTRGAGVTSGAGWDTNDDDDDDDDNDDDDDDNDDDDDDDDDEAGTPMLSAEPIGTPMATVWGPWAPPSSTLPDDAAAGAAGFAAAGYGKRIGGTAMRSASGNSRHMALLMQPVQAAGRPASNGSKKEPLAMPLLAESQPAGTGGHQMLLLPEPDSASDQFKLPAAAHPDMRPKLSDVTEGASQIGLEMAAAVVSGRFHGGTTTESEMETDDGAVVSLAHPPAMTPTTSGEITGGYIARDGSWVLVDTDGRKVSTVASKPGEGSPTRAVAELIRAASSSTQRLGKRGVASSTDPLNADAHGTSGGMTRMTVAAEPLHGIRSSDGSHTLSPRLRGHRAAGKSRDARSRRNGHSATSGNVQTDDDHNEDDDDEEEDDDDDEDSSASDTDQGTRSGTGDEYFMQRRGGSGTPRSSADDGGAGFTTSDDPDAVTSTPARGTSERLRKSPSRSSYKSNGTSPLRGMLPMHGDAPSDTDDGGAAGTDAAGVAASRSLGPRSPSGRSQAASSGAMERLESDGELGDDKQQQPQPLPLRGLRRRDVFIFSYGCIVMWGFQGKEEELAVLERLRRYMIEPLDRGQSDIMTYRQENKSGTSAARSGNGGGGGDGDGDDDDAEKGSAVRGDEVTLATPSPLERLAVSSAFAQSVKLSVLEDRVSEKINETKDIPRQMAKTGHISMNAVEVSKQIGALFIERASVNFTSDLLDTPDFLWSYDEFQHVYERVQEYLDISDRVETLNRRLDVLHELLNILMAQYESQHSSHLEWIVIWLIAVELVLEAVSIVVDVILFGS